MYQQARPGMYQQQAPQQEEARPVPQQARMAPPPQQMVPAYGGGGYGESAALTQQVQPHTLLALNHTP
jgi:hypothetical protein